MEPVRQLTQGRHVAKLVLATIALAVPAHSEADRVALPGCEQTSVNDFRTRTLTLSCRGEVFREDRTTLLSVEQVDAKYCIVRVAHRAVNPRGCRTGPEPYCAPEFQREYSALIFGDRCALDVPNWPVELPQGVDIERVHRLQRAFESARALVRNPTGLDWTAPMSAWAVAELSDVDSIDYEDGRWRLDFFDCDHRRSDRCQPFSAEFPDAPRSLGDLEAYWLD